MNKNSDRLFNLGISQLQSGLSSDALNTFKQILALKPNDFLIYDIIGIVYIQKNEFLLAKKYFENAIRLNPDDADAYNNTGFAFQKLGDLKNSSLNYAKAVEKNPNLAGGYNNLGVNFRIQKKPREAIENFEKAISLNPKYTEAYINLAATLQGIEDFEKTIKIYQKALEICPNNVYAITHLLNTSQLICQWTSYKNTAFLLDKLINNNLPQGIIPNIDPFINITISDDPKRNLAIARNWSFNLSQKVASQHPPFSFHHLKNLNGKIRIGYLNNFSEEPISTLTKNLFKLHNKKRFEIYAYSYGSFPDNPKLEYVKSFCKKFTDLNPLNFAESAEKIYQDQIEILVDLKGYTNGNKLEILALKPAPVQVSYLGFPGTSGASFFDYIIVDQTLASKDNEKDYSEKLIVMPDCYQIISKMEISKKVFKRKDFNLPQDAFVFTCFNKPQKITPEIFVAWAKILESVPGSVLWLWTRYPLVVANLKKEAEITGLDPKRLIFSQSLPLDQHLKRLSLADLALDTFVYNGGATTSQMLLAGVPIVTLQGKTYLSRMSSSLLKSVGLEELITENLDDYKNLAINLAINPKKLSTIRHTLNVNKKTHPLFDTKKFVRNLEKVYQKILLR